MNKEKTRKILLALGVILILVYVAVMIFEIKSFSPYNKRMFLFADRAFEFLLPAIICFIARMSLKER